MCGRIIQASGPFRYRLVDGLDVPDSRYSNFPRRYNSAPSQELLVIRQNHETGEPTPDHLIRDRDACYGDVFVRRVQSLGIRDQPTPGRSSWQNGHAEWLIGSIRRECLDHIVVIGQRNLRQTLLSYMEYYNAARTHLSLSKDAPIARAVQPAGRIQARQILGGHHHQYARI